jgi:hypothetical protein
MHAGGAEVLDRSAQVFEPLAAFGTRAAWAIAFTRAVAFRSFAARPVGFGAVALGTVALGAVAFAAYAPVNLLSSVADALQFLAQFTGLFGGGFAGAKAVPDALFASGQFTPLLAEV